MNSMIKNHRHFRQSVHLFMAAALLTVSLILGSASPSNAESEFRFPKKIAQELNFVFVALTQNDWTEARRLSGKLITNYELQLNSDATEEEIDTFYRGFIAALTMDAIASYQLKDYRRIADILLKQHTWKKQTKGYQGISTYFIDVQFHLNTVIAELLDGNLKVAQKHLLEARKINENLPNDDNIIEPMHKALANFRSLTDMATYLYVQRSGHLPIGVTRLEPGKIDTSSESVRTLFYISELMRSVALSRIGQLKQSEEILEKFPPSFQKDDAIQSLMLFHKGCILASEGKDKEAERFLKEAEVHAKKAGIILPLSEIISDINSNGSKPIWPPQLTPTSDRFFLKIIPTFALNINFNFESYGDQELPASFEEKFGPSIFINFSP